MAKEWIVAKVLFTEKRLLRAMRPSLRDEHNQIIPRATRDFGCGKCRLYWRSEFAFFGFAVTHALPNKKFCSSQSSQIIERIWRPRRDLNPCYRRERAMS